MAALDVHAAMSRARTAALKREREVDDLADGDRDSNSAVGPTARADGPGNASGGGRGDVGVSGTGVSVGGGGGSSGRRCYMRKFCTNADEPHMVHVGASVELDPSEWLLVPDEVLSKRHKVECKACGKRFVISTSDAACVSVATSSSRAPCMPSPSAPPPPGIRQSW